MLLAPLASFAAEYQLCFLEDGPNAGNIEKIRAESLQAAHMAHISAMWKSGALESAGPVGGLPGARGIFLFRASAAEAAKLGAADPKVQAGDLKLSCSTWTGPAGVGKAYREAYGKPGFVDQMRRKVVVLLKDQIELDNVIVAGPLSGSPYRYFAVLDADDLAKVQRTMPEVTAFVWFHDTRVWNGVS